jgi:uncharacterized protein YbjT (DUF2867 family)
VVVLVTGANGRIGPRIVAALQARGHEVRAAGRRGPVKLDLATGDGLADAVRGVDAVVHAASAAFGNTRGVDVDGTRRLREAAPDAHVVYASIVGCDRVHTAYYQAKVDAEQVLIAAGRPHTIARITQFHVFVDQMFATMAWSPVLIALNGVTFQPIDEQEAAEALAACVDAGPSGRITDLGGPEVLPMGAMLREWVQARRKWRLVMPFPALGGPARAMADGGLCCPEGNKGTKTWTAWLDAP